MSRTRELRPSSRVLGMGRFRRNRPIWLLTLVLPAFVGCQGFRGKETFRAPLRGARGPRARRRPPRRPRHKGRSGRRPRFRSRRGARGHDHVVKPGVRRTGAGHQRARHVAFSRMLELPGRRSAAFGRAARGGGEGPRGSPRKGVRPMRAAGTAPCCDQKEAGVAPAARASLGQESTRAVTSSHTSVCHSCAETIASSC